MDLEQTERYFRQWNEWLQAAVAAGGLQKAVWRRRQPIPPIEAIQVAARHHPNARVRRDCLNTLDHCDNDGSAKVYCDALGDPVARVRVVALHGLGCERCRDSELCVPDVVPVLLGVLEHDPSPKVRHDCVRILLRLSSRDDRAGEAIRRAALEDDDDLVREVAAAAAEGRYGDIRSRKALRRRARTKTVPRD